MQRSPSLALSRVFSPAAFPRGSGTVVESATEPATTGASWPAPATAAQRPVLVVWALSLWLASAGNLPLWQRIDALGGTALQRIGLMIGFGVLLTGAMATLLSLLSWPRMLRPLSTVLVLVTGLNSYFMWQYGVVIDPTMLGNAMQTDAREVRDLLSWSLPGTVLLLAGPPLWLLWRRPMGMQPLWRQAGRNAVGALAALALMVLAALSSYQGLASLMRNHKDLRYMVSPLNTAHAAVRLAMDRVSSQVHPLQPVGEDATLGASYVRQHRPPLLVLVIGETARAQNFGINGYARPTTPALAHWQAQGDLVNFGRVGACGTSTLVSLPCLFSPLARAQGGNQTPEQENLLDVLQRAGLAVLWIDNQAGCKGVCNRVPNASATGLQVPGLCEGGECLDGAMLEGLAGRIDALDPRRRERGVVLVMHQMGSHGPAYAKRSPANQKPFLPECESVTLSDCERQQVVNAYDNSIAYTDQFLDQTLQWLKARALSGGEDTGLIYVSDHGESLGENGLYLHGVPYALAPAEQIQVPMVSWLSPGLQGRNGLSIGCLREQAARTPISHDHFFHTVLGLMDVRTRMYQPALDALQPCRWVGVRSMPVDS